MKAILTCLILLVGVAIGSATQTYYHTPEQRKAFEQGIQAGWFIHHERIVNNILHDTRLGPEDKRGWVHDPYPECYLEWEDVIETYDYGQHDK